MTKPASQETNRRTPLAIVLAVALVLPGMLLGGAVALAYSALMTDWHEGAQWNSFFATAYEFLLIGLMPEFIRGAVAMYVSLGLTFLTFKRANRAAVTYVVLLVFAIVGVVMTAPPRYRLFALLLGFAAVALPTRVAEATGPRALEKALHGDKG